MGSRNPDLGSQGGKAEGAAPGREGMRLPADPWAYPGLLNRCPQHLPLPAGSGQPAPCTFTQPLTSALLFQEQADSRGRRAVPSPPGPAQCSGMQSRTKSKWGPKSDSWGSATPLAPVPPDTRVFEAGPVHFMLSPGGGAISPQEPGILATASEGSEAGGLSPQHPQPRNGWDPLHPNSHQHTLRAWRPLGSGA